MISREWLLARLGRVTNSGKFLAEIDGLRFIAIGSVILTHVMSNTLTRVPAVSDLDFFLVHLLHRGDVGVQIFFAISGFILALPFAESYLADARTPRLGDYYKRRLYRIEPPYVICLVALTVIAIITHGSERFDRIPHLIASLFYVHNVVYDAWSEINFVAWSLEVEVQFYLIAPFLAGVFKLKSRTARVCLIVGGMIVCGLAAAAVQPMSHRVRMLLPFHLQYFLAGFLLAEVFVRDWHGHPKKAVHWTVIAALAWMAVFWFGNTPSYQALLACLIFVAFFASLQSVAMSSFLSNAWIATIGGMCYTVYLWHFWFYAAYERPTAAFLDGLSFASRVMINTLIGSTVIVIGSAIFFVLFERPFMKKNWPSEFRQRLLPKAQAERA